MDTYHVRFSREEDPKGPFDLDALQTLAENGRLTSAALVFDADRSRWSPLDSLPELHAQIFRKKKSLNLRSAGPVSRSSEGDEPRSPSIEGMLTKDSLNPEVARRLREKERQVRFAALSMDLLSLLLALSALSLLAIPLAETVSRFLSLNRFDASFLLKAAPAMGLLDATLALLFFLKAVPGRWILLARALPGSALLASLPFIGTAGTQPMSFMLAASAIAFGTGILLLALFPRVRVVYPAACLASAGLFLPLALTLAALWNFVS